MYFSRFLFWANISQYIYKLTIYHPIYEMKLSDNIYIIPIFFYFLRMRTKTPLTQTSIQTQTHLYKDYWSPKSSSSPKELTESCNFLILSAPSLDCSPNGTHKLASIFISRSHCTRTSRSIRSRSIDLFAHCHKSQSLDRNSLDSRSLIRGSR